MRLQYLSLINGSRGQRDVGVCNVGGHNVGDRDVGGPNVGGPCGGGGTGHKGQSHKSILSQSTSLNTTRLVIHITCDLELSQLACNPQQ